MNVNNLIHVYKPIISNVLSFKSLNYLSIIFILPLTLMAAKPGFTEIKNDTTKQELTPPFTMALRIKNDPIIDEPTNIPPQEPDSDPCNPDRTYTVNNQALSELIFFLGQTRLQLSHTAQGVPLTPEPRTINLAKGITAAKFRDLERAQEARCNRKPNPAQCMATWVQQMSQTVVHTFQSDIYSYIDWPNSVTNTIGLSHTKVPIPVVEKSVQSKLAKVLTSPLILPIAITVDRARCHINQIESVVQTTTHKAEIQNGRLKIDIPLTGGIPTLKCEGRAAALWGLHSWGWADELFPDVRLTNMQVNASFGGFAIHQDVPVYTSVFVGVHADIDLNNVPGIGEDVINFMKDYTKKSHRKVKLALEKELKRNKVKLAFGKGVTRIIEKQSGDRINRVCSIDSAGNQIRIQYEKVLKPNTIRLRPGKLNIRQ